MKQRYFGYQDLGFESPRSPYKPCPKSSLPYPLVGAETQLSLVENCCSLKGRKIVVWGISESLKKSFVSKNLWSCFNWFARPCVLLFCMEGMEIQPQQKSVSPNTAWRKSGDSNSGVFLQDIVTAYFWTSVHKRWDYSHIKWARAHWRHEFTEGMNFNPCLNQESHVSQRRWFFIWIPALSREGKF